jgi:hypothetical protein
VLATVLAACGQGGGGSSDFEGDERAVAEAVEGLQEAAADRDERRLCRAVLAPAIAQRLGDCEREIQSVLDDADSYELEVEDVRIVDRGRARARVQSGGDEQADRTIELIRVGPDWRISELGAPPRRQPS